MVRFVSCFALVASMLFSMIATDVHAQTGKTICIDGKCYPLVSEVVSTVTFPKVAPFAVAQDATDAAFIPVMKSDTAKFRKNLLEAARLARRSGDISVFQHLALIRASRDVKQLERLKGDIHELAVEDGMATIQAIDWDKLLSFIEKLLPIILKLLG